MGFIVVLLVVDIIAAAVESGAERTIKEPAKNNNETEGLACVSKQYTKMEKAAAINKIV